MLFGVTVLLYCQFSREPFSFLVHFIPNILCENTQYVDFIQTNIFGSVPDDIKLMYSDVTILENRKCCVESDV